MSDLAYRRERSPESAVRSIRLAKGSDLRAVAVAVGELLLELGASPPASEAMEEAAGALIEDPALGATLLAEADGGLVGCLGVSWQCAVRVPGRYGLIQELWVDPEWRSQAIGEDLLQALFALARELGVKRIEVGLPGEGFSHLAATEAFYLNNDFKRNGVRMRRQL
jgi:GNAT superfamily N-acetyltransferase